MAKVSKRLSNLKAFLDEKVEQYNRKNFIEQDPIIIPHRFRHQQDIEIAGWFAATLAWGQRVTIINKCNELLRYMDDSPHQFILHHRDRDLRPFEQFKHRTFNPTDALYFISFLKKYYQKHESLEEAFQVDSNADHIGDGLIRFRNLVFEDVNHPKRSQKHVSSPAKKSACKRLNMYLRWMVRQDQTGVDFGIWKKIKPSQLVCPCDVHVERVSRSLRLITGKSMNWETALELTNNLKKLDPTDPVKYDFALFGLGVLEAFPSKRKIN